MSQTNDDSREMNMGMGFQDNKSDGTYFDDSSKAQGFGHDFNMAVDDIDEPQSADGDEVGSYDDAVTVSDDAPAEPYGFGSWDGQATDHHADATPDAEPTSPVSVMGYQTAQEEDMSYRSTSQSSPMGYNPPHETSEDDLPHIDTIRSDVASTWPRRVSVPSSPYAAQAGDGDGHDGEDKKAKKKGGHAPWLVGGIAVGALVAGLGTFAAINIANNGGFDIPDHTTTQWEGSPSDEKGDNETDGKDAKSDDKQQVTAQRTGTSGSDSVTLARDVASQCLPSVVAIHVSDGMSAGMGSGVIVDEDGHILTNSHVVKDMTEIVVVSGEGEEYVAKVLGLDDSSDLAVLDVEWGDKDVTPMTYGDSSALMVGDWVMTIGSPFGLDQSASTGIVSALSRNQMMESYGGYRIYANLIQTDAAINMGNSGGALVNANGELVGINSMLASNSGSYAAVGFAIPSNYAKRVADQIIAGKEVEHAYIGAQFGSVSMVASQQTRPHGTVIDETGKEVEADDGTPKTGAYVAGVVDGSPAQEAGMQEGDIVTKFGDENISSASGIIMEIRSYEIGDKVPVTVWRDGKEITLEVTLGTDKGTGLYDNEGKSQQQQQQQQQQQSPFGQSPYGGDGMDWEFFERMLEDMGLQ